MDTMTFPIENLEFPTVTLCPKDPRPDRWGLFVKIFDFFKMKCQKG